MTLFQRRDIPEQREKEFIAKHVSGYATGECEKKGLTEFYHQQGWKKDGLM